MKYDKIIPGVFISRPNRFVALVSVDGQERECHVKNTGRCRELLVPGARVFLQETGKPGRKTKYDLISVYKGSRLVNMDSQAPNKVFAEYIPRLLGDGCSVQREKVYGSSRLDFFIRCGERKIYAEVKGVTLEQSGAALFPDAPTQRGVKHLRELCRAKEEGYEALAVFIIQMEGVDRFSPNDQTHPLFGETLRAAKKAGVELLALDCRVTEDEITPGNPVKIIL